MNVKDTIEAVLWAVVDKGNLAGAATLIWRRDSVRVACVGVRDLVEPLAG